MSNEQVKHEAADELEILRHSAAHLLAHAVLDLFPGTQAGIGPAVENGFYYDFLRDEPFSSDDLAAIEAQMREIAAADIPIVREMLPKDGSRPLFRKPRPDPQGRAHPGERRRRRFDLPPGTVSSISASARISPRPG